MAKPDALFLLIQSLSPGEKAAVRQGEKGQSGYLALFDLIAKQKTYDEAKAKKKLADAGHQVNFSYAKNYLTKHILAVLRDNDDSGPNAGNTIVQDIEILIQRRIYDLAERMVTKAIERTLHEERWHDYLQLSSMQLELILHHSSDVEVTVQTIEDINQNRTLARQSMNILGELEDLYFRHRPIIKHKLNARHDMDLARIDRLAAHPLMKDRDAISTSRAKRLQMLCESLVQTFRGQYAQSMDTLNELVLLYRNVKWLRNDHPDSYLNDLWRLGGMKLHFGAYAEVEEILTEIEALYGSKGLHDSEIFEKHSRLLLGYALHTRNYTLANAKMPAIQQGLLSHSEMIPWTSLSMLLVWVARVHFEQQQYKEAKSWINHILDHPQRGQREDTVGLARLMLIFIYFETGESDLCESQCKATRKFLQRRDSLHAFERTILRFLENHSFTDKNAQLIQAMKQLRTELAEIFKNPLEANFLAYFDILRWLDTKTA
ncbi:MAG: hypothetical protein U0176_23665 [Bacteroidia bacterium]